MKHWALLAGIPARKSDKGRQTMRTRYLLASSAVALALAAPASATTVDLLSVEGTWVSITGGVGTAGVGTDEISWGSTTGGGRSSYVFEGVAPPPELNIAPNVLFDLGEFTHNNFPIPSGSGITGARLRVDYSLAIPSGGGAQSFSAFFDFDHFETPNNEDPCADGNPNFEGVNINGCADRVRITTDFDGSESVTIGDTTYFLSISGFGIDSDVEFWTIEEDSNSIGLRAEFVTRVDVIPLPAAGWMLLTALGGLGFAAHRRRRNAA